MKTLTKTTIAAAIALMMTITNGCKKEDMNNVASAGDMPAAKTAPSVLPPINMGTVEVKMVSTPVNGVGAVDVEITEVLVHYAIRGGSHGWVSLYVKDNIYDLEQYHDGKSVVLGATARMPFGKIDEIRVMVGKRNSLVKGDADGLRHSYPLIVSGASYGNVNTQIGMKQGSTLVVTVDFNAQKSVNFEGGGTYYLTPALELKNVEYIPMMENQ